MINSKYIGLPISNFTKNVIFNNLPDNDFIKDQDKIKKENNKAKDELIDDNGIGKKKIKFEFILPIKLDEIDNNHPKSTENNKEKENFEINNMKIDDTKGKINVIESKNNDNVFFSEDEDDDNKFFEVSFIK